MTVDFSHMKSRKPEGSGTTFSSVERKGLPTANFIYGKVSFRNEDEIKNILKPKKAKIIYSSRPTLKNWLKEFL